MQNAVPSAYGLAGGSFPSNRWRQHDIAALSAKQSLLLDRAADIAFWQRAFILVSCFVLRRLLASVRSGVVNTFRYANLAVFFFAQFRSDVHQDSAQHVPPLAVSTVTPVIVVRRVFDDLRVPCCQQ